MKKILFVLSLLCISVTSFAQVSYGKFTRFPDKKLFGLLYKPQLGFAKVDENTVLVLNYIDPSSYASFDKTCKLLFRTDDNQLHRAEIIPDMQIVKDYSSSWNSALKCYSHFYNTYSFYNIPDELLNDITSQTHKIIKIRIIFSNGNLKDYDLNEKNSARVTEELAESYSSASVLNAVRKENMQNDDAGF